MDRLEMDRLDDEGLSNCGGNLRPFIVTVFECFDFSGGSTALISGSDVPE
jgi:hypothetical protein